jgi:hypothetical protein
MTLGCFGIWSNPALDCVPIQALALQLAWLGFEIQWSSFSNSRGLKNLGRKAGPAVVAAEGAVGGKAAWRKEVGQGTGGGVTLQGNQALVIK